MTACITCSVTALVCNAYKCCVPNIPITVISLQLWCFQQNVQLLLLNVHEACKLACKKSWLALHANQKKQIQTELNRGTMWHLHLWRAHCQHHQLVKFVIFTYPTSSPLFIYIRNNTTKLIIYQSSPNKFQLAYSSPYRETTALMKRWITSVAWNEMNEVIWSTERLVMCANRGTRVVGGKD